MFCTTIRVSGGRVGVFGVGCWKHTCVTYRAFWLLSGWGKPGCVGGTCWCRFGGCCCLLTVTTWYCEMKVEVSTCVVFSFSDAVRYWQCTEKRGLFFVVIFHENRLGHVLSISITVKRLRCPDQTVGRYGMILGVPILYR